MLSSILSSFTGCMIFMFPVCILQLVILISTIGLFPMFITFKNESANVYGIILYIMIEAHISCKVKVSVLVWI